MNDVTVKFGASSDDDKGGFNNPFENSVMPAGMISFCEILVQEYEWVNEKHANDPFYGFKPLQQGSLVGRVEEAKAVVNHYFRDYLQEFNGGFFPIWLDKSYTGRSYIECSIRIDHVTKIKVRICIKLISYDEKGKMVITDLRSS